MSIDRLSQLKSLRLYGMATAWSELLAEGPRLPMQPEAWLDRLIDAEQTDRQVMLPLFCGVLSSRLTRLFCAVPRTSVSRIA